MNMKVLRQTTISPEKSDVKRRQSSGQLAAIPPAKRPKMHLVIEPTTEAKQKQEIWVDKYRPTSMGQLIGQQTEKSSANKLLAWLRNWAKCHLAPQVPGEKKKAKPSPFQAQHDGTGFKAALLSGPPGIGKTTCTLLCCKELGLSYVEMNASDVRNKVAIDKHTEQLTSNQMEKYYSRVTGEPVGQSVQNGQQSQCGKSKRSGPGSGSAGAKQGGKQKEAAKVIESSSGGKMVDHVLIMDEVDGMSGNADRAGIAELIQMVKRTRVPIICICNDRQSKKIRSLANYCFDLRFQRPRADQMKGKLLSILAKERVNLPKDSLEKIIEASNQDIRQAINTLQLMAGDNNRKNGASNKFQKKDVAVNIFEAARQILSENTPLLTKCELYFTDYSIMPLFVQENYPNVRGSRMNNLEHIGAIKRAADSIAFGDIIDRQVRSQGHWNLLNEQAMFSCALPSTIMDGYMTTQIQFPSWFGKYSNAQKRHRLMRQLAMHTYMKINGSNQALVQDYLGALRERLYRPLIRQETAGVKEVLGVYNHYSLVKDDMEAINELGAWPVGNKHTDLATLVSTKAKSALTRQLNKEKRLLPFSQPGQVTKTAGRRKKGAADEGGRAKAAEVDEEGDEAEEEEGEGPEGEGAEEPMDY